MTDTDLRRSRYEPQLVDFGRAVLFGEQLAASAEEAVGEVAVITAMYRSGEREVILTSSSPHPHLILIILTSSSPHPDLSSPHLVAGVGDGLGG